MYFHLVMDWGRRLFSVFILYGMYFPRCWPSFDLSAWRSLQPRHIFRRKIITSHTWNTCLIGSTNRAQIRFAFSFTKVRVVTYIASQLNIPLVAGISRRATIGQTRDHRWSGLWIASSRGWRDRRRQQSEGQAGRAPSRRRPHETGTGQWWWTKEVSP